MNLSCDGIQERGAFRVSAAAKLLTLSAIPSDFIREQLSKILNSDLFSESPRMARFLRFIVEETLSGNAPELKENVIGVQVFDRSVTYDPRIDPIVRVEARRVRTKLRDYYEKYGKDDQLIIDFPKGRYAPSFRRRQEPEQRTSQHVKSSGTAIAILPFANLTAESGTEFLSDGLTEELINALTRIPQLRVVAWTSAAQLRGKQEEIDEIKDRLQVDYILRGSIRQAKERLRVSAHLIDTAKQQYIWSESYNRELKDIFAIEQEIAASIVVALRLKIAAGTDLLSVGEDTRNVDSYQICLKGRFHARERTEEGLQRSLVCFEQAIALDPQSSSAQAGLADTYTLLAEYGIADGPTCMEKAKTAVQRALALNASSAEAFASFGLILSTHDWSWSEACRAFDQAIQLNPGYAPAHHWYGIDCLAMLGRFKEARYHTEIAIDLDPLSSVILQCRAYICLLTRDYDEAIRHNLLLQAMDPSFYKAHTSLGRAYLQRGNYAKAIEFLEKGLALAGEVPSILGALGQAYGVAGKVMEAQQVLKKLDELSAVRSIPFTSFALVHIGLGNIDKSLDYLQKAVDRREGSVIGLKVHPAFDPLREETRFHKLLERVGFDSLP